MPSQRRAKAKRREERQYKEALATQLRFIQRSCEVFDQGHWDEAIRIATQLRIILNPGGGNKKSLLQHLGINRQIKLLSTCHGASPGMGSFEYKSDGVNVSMRFYASLGDTPVAYEMKAQEWWDQIVYVLPPETADKPSLVLRRKDISLRPRIKMAVHTSTLC